MQFLTNKDRDRIYPLTKIGLYVVPHFWKGKLIAYKILMWTGPDEKGEYDTYEIADYDTEKEAKDEVLRISMSKDDIIYPRGFEPAILS